MKKYLSVLVFLIFFIAFTQLTYSQATRTWVSGVGDDVNPCSRTAPCKTFAGAISKTAINGEINAIDPAGYGAVTITKSIIIDGKGTMASILSSLTNGIIINGSDAVVTIRHININGAGNGINGIRIMAARKVIIEDCVLNNFTQSGIEAGGTDNYIVIINNVTVHNAANAVTVSNTSASVLADHCTLQSITGAGINQSGGTAMVSNSTISDCNTAVSAGSNTTVTLSGNIISNNGTAYDGSGKIFSAGNNTLAGNKATGVSVSTAKLQ